MEVPGHDNERPLARLATGQVRDGSQRRTMQVIEMRMGDQYGINSRQIAHSQSGTTQSLQHKNPAGEVRVDQYVFSANLQEEAGVPNECNSQLSSRRQNRLPTAAGTRGERRAPDQCAELSGLSSDADAYHVRSAY